MKLTPGKRGPARFAWTYGDLSDLTGLSVKSLYNYRSRGAFDPGVFPTVINFLLERGVDERVIARRLAAGSCSDDTAGDCVSG